jgi:hypothetical protein
VALVHAGLARGLQVADYGLVATWESTVPQLIAEIKKGKAAQ